MIRSLLAAIVIVALGLGLGCGGGPDPLEGVAPAKPKDIGTPDQWPMGAKMYENGPVFIVKQDVGGEVRMWAPVAKITMLGLDLQYDPDKEIFHDKGRKRQYDLEGRALFEIFRGPDKGKTPPPLDRKKIEYDQETGHILLYLYKNVPEEDWDDPGKGGYIVVP